MEQILRRTQAIPSLTSWLTINRACNLRCGWCYAQMTEFSRNDDMRLKTAQESIQLLKDLSLDSVILIGGEPTIHPHFLDIVQMIVNAGMKAYLVTNAIRFSNKRFLDEALSAGISSITISFKAADQESYRKATGRNAFSKALQAIRNISDSGISHVVNVTVCEEMIKSFDRMIEVVAQSGARAFSVDTGKPVLLGGKTSIDGMSDPKRLAEFFMEIYPKLERSGLRFSVKIAIPFCLFPKEFVDKLIADGNLLTGCQMVSGRGIVIDPHGEVIPCNHLCDQPIARVGEDFSDRESYIQFRKREEVIHFYDIVSSAPHSRCLACQFWKMCGSGCKLYWLHYRASDLMGNFQLS